MKKLTIKQIQEKERLLEALIRSQVELLNLVAEFNDKMRQLRNPVEAKIDKINTQVAEVNAWLDTIHADQETYFDNQSAEWQESDEGQDYFTWMHDFSDYYSEVDILFPDSLEMPDLNVIDELTDLPDEPDLS